MNVNSKRSIAKEVLILFSSLLLCSTVVFIIYARNEYRIANIRSLQKVGTFSPEVGFEYLLEQDIRTKYLVEEFDFSDIVDDPRDHHITQLYKILNESNYIFLQNEHASNVVLFNKVIMNELVNQFDHPNLENIYEFLKERKYLQTDFYSFYASLSASMTSDQKATIERKKLLSNEELKRIAIWTSIIIFSISYPLRYLIMLLVWAISIVKTDK